MRYLSMSFIALGLIAATTYITANDASWIAIVFIAVPMLLMLAALIAEFVMGDHTIRTSVEFEYPPQDLLESKVICHECGERFDPPEELYGREQAPCPVCGNDVPIRTPDWET